MLLSTNSFTQMTSKVSIHQPEHLPWLGFFNKMKNSDVMVLLDTVQYSKGDVQNRNRIITQAGLKWLTVPVEPKSWHKKIQDVQIVPGDWQETHLAMLESAYCMHPHFDEVSAVLRFAYEDNQWSSLRDLNLDLIRRLSLLLGINTKLVLASDLMVDSELPRDEYNAGLVRAVEGNVYLCGPKASDYQDDAVFTNQGIHVRPLAYVPRQYPQYKQAGFIPALSSVDFLMNSGTQSSWASLT